MARGEIFRFRLTEPEARELDRQAEEKQVTKADLIREAVGLKPLHGKRTPMGKRLAEVKPSSTRIDRQAEPGKAAIDALAKRIRTREGKTTPVARREAAKRLKEATP